MFNDKFVLGLAYRWSASVSAMAGFQVTKGMYIGYGYDHETTQLRKYNSGSHEVMLSFVITKKKPTLEEEDDKLNNSIMEDMKQKMEEKEKN